MDATVLVVEPDDVSREVVEVSLRSAGWRVVTAGTGLEALQHIEAGPPDAIISETHMPGMDGFELIRRLRQRADWSVIPFIIVTEHRSPEDRMRGLELGVEDYLTKPVFMQELVTRVRIALARAQRARIESETPTRTRFTGRLSDMSVADLVQTVDMSRKSGVIHLERDDKVRGEIYVRDGKVVDAESGRHTGERALYRLLLWRDGSFTIEFKTIHRRDTIVRGNQAALLEGMRRLDEWNRLLEGMPQLHSSIEVIYERLAERLGDVPDSVNSLLRVLDGRRTIEQAVEDCELDDVDALRAAKLLYEKGMLRVVVTRPATADRTVTPPPTPVAPHVTALTTRRPASNATRALPSSGGAEAVRAAFSAPEARPTGATTVMGHAVLTPVPSRHTTPPVSQNAPAIASAPRVTMERTAIRPTTPPASAQRVAPERSAARPPPAPSAGEAPRAESRRPPTEPPPLGGGSPGRVRRTTPIQAPVIPFPTPLASPAAVSGAIQEPSFVRSLSEIGRGRPTDGGTREGGAEVDFFSVGGGPPDIEAPLGDSDLSGIQSLGSNAGKKVFVALVGVALVVGAVVAVAVTRDSGDRVLKSPPAVKRTPPPIVKPTPPPAPVAESPVPRWVAPLAPDSTTVAEASPTAEGAAAPPAPPAPAVSPDGDYAALLIDARKAYARGRAREAAKLADRALAVNPAGDEAMAIQASVALDAGRSRVALEWADKALAHNADSARAHAVKGAILYEKGRVAEAKKHFERYLELEPQGELAGDVRQALREI